MNRCAVCGRVVSIVVSRAGFAHYCPGCDLKSPPLIAGYQRESEYTTPDGRFQFTHLRDDYWWRFDMLENAMETVFEQELPPDLVPLPEWQAAYGAAQAVVQLYGGATQLAFQLALLD